MAPDRFTELEGRVDGVERKVDQLRVVFGLNGNTSPEAAQDAASVWRDLVVIVKRDRASAELRESYAHVAADMRRRFSFMQHPWTLLKWLLPALGGALAWRVANAMHIHTPWGSL